MFLCNKCSGGKKGHGRASVGACDNCDAVGLCHKFDEPPDPKLEVPDLPNANQMVNEYNSAVRSLADKFDDDSEELQNLKTVVSLPNQLLKSYNFLWIMIIEQYYQLSLPLDTPRAMGLCTEFRLRLWHLLMKQGFAREDGTIIGEEYQRLKNAVNQS